MQKHTSSRFRTEEDGVNRTEVLHLANKCFPVEGPDPHPFKLFAEPGLQVAGI
jgi:hypothetical protein